MASPGTSGGSPHLWKGSGSLKPKRSRFTAVIKGTNERWDNAFQVDPHDFSWDERRLGAVSQSFSKADSHRLLLPKPINLQPGAFYMISAIIKARPIRACFLVVKLTDPETPA